MMKFKYRARASSGEMVEGTVEADDQKSALNTLRGQGMIVVNLNAQGGGSSRSNAAQAPKSSHSSGGFSLKSLMSIDIGHLLSGGKVPLKTLMIFFRQLATMETAGLSLATSIDVIAGGEKNASLRYALSNIKNRLDRGMPLSQAMSQEKAFSTLIISLVEAGEEGGLLGQALEQSATLLEKQEQLRSKIKSAMFYPAFIMVFAIGILILFFMFLVPKFEETFAALNIELPQITLIMFGIGNWFSQNWYIVAGVFAGIILGLYFLSTNKATKGTMDKIKLKIPVMKDLLLKAAMARSSRTLSALTSAGVPIVRGLEMAQSTAGNVAVEEGYSALRQGVIRGVSLGDSARQAKIFPILVSQMMRIGEETGHLDNMLERVATWYDQELDEQVKATVSLLEPMLIVFVGAIIAIIATSIFAPVTSAIVQLS
ncbi:MAG: type II secretion system F family protein [Synergistaceae bacterium]|nr:type II secretion system F family protein [Synergistaceae bacterium]